MKKIKLSPSASAKWLNCPGSVKEEKKYQNKSNKYSVEGTIAHKLSEICLKQNKNPENFLNTKIKNFKISNEMILNVKKYINYIKKYKNHDSLFFVEKQITFEKNHYEGIGTLDACIISNNVCHIFDFKYGKGILVKAKNNSQLLLYAIGILNFLNEKNIDCHFFQMHIVQPRKNNYDHFLIDINYLLKIKKEYQKKALLTLQENPQKIPGNIQCQWCLAKKNCLSLKKYLDSIVFDQFNNLEKIQTISDLQKKHILDNYDLIQNYMKTIKDEIYQKLKKGENFYDYQIKKGKKYRKWKKGIENKIKNLYGNQLFCEKLINITEAEKIIDKQDLENYIEKNYSTDLLTKKEKDLKCLK